MSISTFIEKGFFRYDVIFLRDLFLFLTAKVSALFGHQFYGLFNYTIWFFCIFLTQKIFSIKKGLSGFLILGILLCHPMLGWIITWPTANKHLLACVFSLGFIYFSSLLEKKPRLAEWGMIVSFFLALNSQPITLLIPFSLLIIYPLSTLKKHIPVISILVGMLAFYSTINAFYYHEIYPHFTQADKFAPVRKDTIALNFLGVSRAFSQILLPLSFGTYYSPSSLLNIIGFPVFFILTFLSKNQFHTKDLLWRLFLVFCPLIVIYTRPTNVFVSDPYYLFSLCILVPTLFHFSLNKRSLFPFLLLLTLATVPKTFWETKISTTESLRFIKTFEREPSCKSAISAAAIAMRDLRVDEFKMVSSISLQNKCLLYGTDAPRVVKNIYAFWLYLNKDLSSEEKLRLLKPTKNITMIQEVLYLKEIQKKKPEDVQMSIEKIKDILRKKESLTPEENFIKEVLERNL